MGTTIVIGQAAAAACSGTSFGGNFCTGFLNLANEFAFMGVGIATLALVILGLGLMFSWFDRGIMHHLKNALLAIIGGAAMVGGAGIAASFIITNFHF